MREDSVIRVTYPEPLPKLEFNQEQLQAFARSVLRAMRKEIEEARDEEA